MLRRSLLPQVYIPALRIGREQRGLFVVAGGCDVFAESGELRVQELGGEGLGEGFDGSLLLGCEGLRGETLGGAGELLLANGFGGELELLDGFDGRGLREACAVAFDFAGDDGFCGFGFAAADGLVLRGYLLKVVHVVDEAAFELVDLGGYVAGDGDVDEEDGTVAAAMQEGAGFFRGEDLAGSGAGDDDVGAVGLLVKLIEGDNASRDGGGAQRVGDLFGAGFSAVGDEEGCSSLLDEVTGGEVGHLPCTDDEDGLAGE